MLKTTFIILNWRERRSGGNEDDEKWEKEENWMLLYSVHSSRSFLLEGEHSIEALEKNWCVCVMMMNDSEIWERDDVRILCKEHNIRTERCDCEHRAVLAGQQSSLLPKLTVIHLTTSLQK